MKRRIAILLCSVISVCTTLALSVYTVIKQTQITNEEPPVVENVPVTLPEDGEGSGDDLGNVSLINKETVSVYVGETITNEVMVQNKDIVLAETDILTFDETNGYFVAEKAGSAVVSIQLENEIRQITIQVFGLGDGSEENPYNILNADKLIELVADGTNNMSSVYFVQQADLDLSAYESWKPIGDMQTAFLANYDGNGYSINNLNIVVTAENLSDYVVERQSGNGAKFNTVTLGFFGRVGDSNNSVVIKNINFNNANIDTSAVDGLDTLDISYIGVLAGQVRYSTVEGITADGQKSSINATINSALTINDINYPDGVIAGLVGCAEDSTISGYEVEVDFVSSSYGFVSGTTYYGSSYAGLVGLMFDTTLTSCDVTMTWQGQNYVQTIVNGVACFVYDNAQRTQENATISDINVNGFEVKVTRFTDSKTVAARVAGGFDYIDGKTFVKNVNVNDIKIAGLGTAQAVGMVSINYGTIQDSTTDGQILASISAGFVYRNNGSITYTETLETPVVSGKIYGQTYVGGFAVYNYGQITSSETNEVTTSLYWSAVNTYFLSGEETVDTKYMIAGFAVVSAGENSLIEGFKTDNNIYDAINAAGGVGYFGGHTYTSNGTTYVKEGGVINNCQFATTIRTVKGIKAGESAKTKYQGKANVFGGVVAFVTAREENNAEIKNVTVATMVNNTATTDGHKKAVYGLNVFGGVVGVANGDVTLDNISNVYSEVYCSYSAETAKLGNIVGLLAENVNIANTIKAGATFFIREGVNHEETKLNVVSPSISATIVKAF